MYKYVSINIVIILFTFILVSLSVVFMSCSHLFLFWKTDKFYFMYLCLAHSTVPTAPPACGVVTLLKAICY